MGSLAKGGDIKKYSPNFRRVYVLSGFGNFPKGSAAHKLMTEKCPPDGEQSKAVLYPWRQTLPP